MDVRNPCTALPEKKVLECRQMTETRYLSSPCLSKETLRPGKTHAKNYVIVKKVKMHTLFVYFHVCQYVSLFKSVNKPHIPHPHPLGTTSVIFGSGCWVNLNEFKNPNSHFWAWLYFLLSL